MELDRNGLEVLARDECMDLLAARPVGRLGLTMAALPVILPVTYAVVGGEVVLRTGSGTKLRAAARHQVACFEVDDVDPDRRSGWSVLVTGPLREVVHPAELAAMRSVPLASWLPGGGDHLLALHPRLVSGRRLAPAPLAAGAPVPA